MKPRIIAEKYMTDDGDELQDYKVHNFNGVPKVVLLCRDRFKEAGLTEDFFTGEWIHLDVKRLESPNAEVIAKQPMKLKDMLEMAERLSARIPFLRTDFYEVNGNVYFGELTFFPTSGFNGFDPETFDHELGGWITLPDKWGG